MEKKLEKTFYAPAERANYEALLKQNAIFKNSKELTSIADSVSQMLVVLNKERQIVYSNQNFLALLNLPDNDEYIGRRAGEILNCVYSGRNEGGCGTSEFCQMCGAVNAMLESQTGVTSIKECSIIQEDNEALDLKVKATPYKKNGEDFTFFVITDISNEKRRQILERLFFHDVLNSAGGISGLSGVMSDIEDPAEIAEIAQLIHHSSNHLISEITLQRQVSAAENGDLELKFTNSESISILQGVADLYSKHEITAGKHISIDKNSENFSFETDALLLRRIIGNMLKNALEASLPETTVTLAVVKDGESPLFSVHNQNYIERKAQLQLFKRSFTTKGTGRGLGTYSMKLFGEKYLKGQIWFESFEEKGTTFFIKLPAKIS